jgi:hypothetical protein
MMGVDAVPAEYQFGLVGSIVLRNMKERDEVTRRSRRHGRR